ncbi:MAG: alpha-L-fucosidase [Halobacteriales archaeon]
MTTHYEPTRESLAAHPVPDWYADAKLGIFIHWGVYSVPAWANPEGDHAYAEWYPYYMYEEGSDTYEYHREEYGETVEYADFIDDWNAENWDPDRWADFFAEVGARYVVLTGEHHDGFPLWPTHYTEYNAAEMGPERDLVGELCEAVRDRGLKFAASYHANLNYYQPGFEGRFGHPDYAGGPHGAPETAPGAEYVDFMNAKHRELIRRYEPDLLWFDTPQADADHLRAHELVADYYNRAAERDKDVVVNNRAATDAHADFVTPEYETFGETHEEKWETCRGIGRSFGYNQVEGPEHHLSGAELVWLLVDVVSKNGNLLINVGPRADGTIPDLQREPLLALGEWLDAHGEAVYGTTYWARAEGSADVVEDDAAPEVRYTWQDDTLYAILDAWPDEEFALGVGEHASLDAVEGVRLLGDGGDPAWHTDGESLVVETGDVPGDRPAHALAIDGVPLARE